MAENISFEKRWRDFKASKTVLVWACLASVGATMAVGFTWGGWMMGSSAEYATSTAVSEARMDLLASVCVDRFGGAENASGRLADLRKIGEWERRDVIRNGGWINVNNIASPTDGAAATLCVERLMAAQPVQLKAAN